MNLLMEKGGIKFNLREDEEQVINEAFIEDPYRIETIERGGIVIDIGAHIGTFALRCAIERDCMVYAYEPNHSTYELLVENVTINGLEGKVIPFKLAIGRVVGKRSFYSRPYHHVSSSLYLNHYTKDAPGYLTSEVQCTTLKQIFEDNDISECVALKIDCEEAEEEVFSEESEKYFKRASYVALEWHFYDGRVYADYLSNLGFSTLLTGCGDPPPPYHITFARGYLYGWRVRDV